MVVAIMAEGIEHALAIGVTKMSTEEMYLLKSIKIKQKYLQK